MQRYDEEIVVVKYGGHAMGDEAWRASFARDIVLLEQTAINPVVVHGGGPQIGAMLKKLGIKSRVRRRPAHHRQGHVEIVEMVLAGSINKQIVGFINAAGGKAIGLCGKDGNMVQARKVTRTVVDPDSNIEKVVDLGFVGEPEKVDTDRAQPGARARDDPGAGAGRDLGRRRRPTTSTPTRSPAPSPAR